MLNQTRAHRGIARESQFEGPGIRLIAAATEKRVPTWPDLPTIAETVPGFQTSVWFGLLGPANMPPEILAKLQRDVAKALDLTQFFRTNSFERVDLSPQEFRKRIQSDLAHWSALIKAVGVKIE